MRRTKCPASATVALVAPSTIVVKKYPNRRLYDTSESRYITLEDLAGRIRKGKDVQVVDAQSGADLTQTTLTQIILESRGGAKLLPVPLLLRLIRMEDEALAEFFGRYVSWALETYLQAKQGARALLPFNPLATAPFAATDALARLVLGAASHLGGRAGAPSPVDASGGPPVVEGDLVERPPPAGPSSATVDDLAALREELAALKSAIGAVGASAKKAAKKRTSRR